MSCDDRLNLQAFVDSPSNAPSLHRLPANPTTRSSAFPDAMRRGRSISLAYPVARRWSSGFETAESSSCVTGGYRPGIAAFGGGDRPEMLSASGPKFLADRVFHSSDRAECEHTYLGYKVWTSASRLWLSVWRGVRCQCGEVFGGGAGLGCIDALVDLDRLS